MNRRELLAAVVASLARPPGGDDAWDRLVDAVQALVDASPRRFWAYVVDRDGPVYRRRRGMEATDAVPLGSVRKLLTAALVLTAVDEGLLALDEPVVRWLPTWGGPERAGITLRRLLSHTAGLKKRPRNGFCQGLGSLGACVDHMADAPLAGAPGAEFRYSSAGFHVAARVLEVAAGRPFAALMQERLLGPLGMADTTLRPAGPELGDMTGEVWSTPPDFAAFLRMLVRRGDFDGRRVLSEAAVAELERGQVGPERFVPGVPAEPWWPPGWSYYALGQWRNAGAPDGTTLVTTAEGKGRDGWFVTWVDRRVDRAGCVALTDPRRAREPFRGVIEATCAHGGGGDCATPWGVLGGEDEG